MAEHSRNKGLQHSNISSWQWLLRTQACFRKQSVQGRRPSWQKLGKLENFCLVISHLLTDPLWPCLVENFNNQLVTSPLLNLFSLERLLTTFLFSPSWQVGMSQRLRLPAMESNSATQRGGCRTHRAHRKLGDRALACWWLGSRASRPGNTNMPPQPQGCCPPNSPSLPRLLQIQRLVALAKLRTWVCPQRYRGRGEKGKLRWR